MSEKRDQSLATTTTFCRAINRFFPFYWVLASQVLMLFLLNSDPVLTTMLSLYTKVADATFLFSKINAKTPFSSDLAKAYTLTVSLLIPLQLWSLLKLDRAELLAIAHQKNDARLFSAFVFFCVCAFVLVFLLPLGETGVIRFLGSGYLAVSLVIPTLTSLFPLIVCIGCYLYRKNSKGA